MQVKHTVTVDSKGALRVDMTITTVSGNEQHLINAITEISIIYRETKDKRKLAEALAEDMEQIVKLYHNVISQEQMEQIFHDILSKADTMTFEPEPVTLR